MVQSVMFQSKRGIQGGVFEVVILGIVFVYILGLECHEYIVNVAKAKAKANISVVWGGREAKINIYRYPRLASTVWSIVHDNLVGAELSLVWSRIPR